MLIAVPLTPVLLLAVGVFELLLALGVYLFLDRLGRKSGEVRRKWRPVTVKILTSRLCNEYSDGGTIYWAEIKYEYTVDGIRYEGDRISFFPRWRSSDRAHHEKLVTESPEGRERSAWINPWNPKEAALTVDGPPPGPIRMFLIILLGSGIATMLAGALVWLTGGGPSP